MNAGNFLTTVPADFEPLSAVVLSAARLGVVFPETFVRVIAELIDVVPLVVLVRDERQRSELLTHLTDWGLGTNRIYFVHSPAALMWVRDYGPQFLRSGDGSYVMLDAEYFRTELPAEDQVPHVLANLLRTPVEPVPLTVEGGNILSNGQGLCLTTEGLLERNAHRGESIKAVAERFRQAYGFNHVIVLEALKREATCHVDMFAAFTSPDTVVMGQYDPRVDPENADVLEYNASLLSRLDFPGGRTLNVVRVPMPTNHGEVWRTYTNVVFANGTLLVPSYAGSDPAVEQAVRETYQKLLPGWRVKPIDTSGLVHGRGVLRCLTCPVPRHEQFAATFAD